MTALEDRCVNLERQLREARRTIDMALSCEHGLEYRRGQLEELAGNIHEALKPDSDFHLLAHVETLEKCAVTMHTFDSEHGLPEMLRGLADGIEAIRQKLDSDGYTEWNLLSGLKGGN